MYDPGPELEVRRFDPSQYRDPHTGKWAHLGAPASAVAHALEKLGGELDALDLSPDDEGGRYFDWSVRVDSHTYRMEIGDGSDAVAMDMNRTEMAHVVSAMSVTRLRNAGPPPDPTSEHDLTLATLAQVGDHGGVALSDQDYGERYLDWSTRTSDGSYRFEAGDADGATVQMDLTPDEFNRLYASLALTLLRDSAKPGETRSRRFGGVRFPHARQAVSHPAL